MKFYADLMKLLKFENSLVWEMLSRKNETCNYQIIYVIVKQDAQKAEPVSLTWHKNASEANFQQGFVVRMGRNEDSL